MDAIWNKNSKRHISKTLEQVLGEDMKNIVCYQDDICVRGTNENEFKKKTDIVLN